jgi:hypothetical protein
MSSVAWNTSSLGQSTTSRPELPKRGRPAPARTRAAGALIVSEIQRRIGIELDVSRTAPRAEALCSLLAQSAAA